MTHREEQLSEVVVNQAIAIAHLTNLNLDYRHSFKEIRLMLVCIGGPLNDNKLKYSADQLRIFYNIEQLLEGLDDNG